MSAKIHTDGIFEWRNLTAKERRQGWYLRNGEKVGIKVGQTRVQWVASAEIRRQNAAKKPTKK